MPHDPKAYRAKYYAEHKDQWKDYRDKQKELGRLAAIKRAQYQRLKDEVYEAYGAKCACCGETERAFLCIDHVNGGGNEFRRRRPGVQATLREVRRRGFPPDYQVLCHNCNHAKELPGGCPHKRSV